MAFSFSSLSLLTFAFLSVRSFRRMAANALENHPLVANLFADFFTGDDFNEQANVSVEVHVSGGALLVPRCWGFVPEDSFSRFAQSVCAILNAGYVIAVDSRVRAGNDVMLYFDLDPLDKNPEVPVPIPEVGKVTEFLSTAVAHFLRVKDVQNKSNLYCAVTRNPSKPLSMHVYFFNVWCHSLAELKTVVVGVQERVSSELASLGLKFDAGPTAMGSCRWPFTYAFNTRQRLPDTRHKIIGVFSGAKPLAPNSSWVQTRTPFDGAMFVNNDYSQPRFPDALLALRLFRPNSSTVARAVVFVYFGTGSGRPSNDSYMDSQSQDSQDGLPPDALVPDHSVDVDIDMTDLTTVLDLNVLRALVDKHGLGREVADHLRVRVCNIQTDVLVKQSNGRGGLYLFRTFLGKMVNGAMSINGLTAAALREQEFPPAGRRRKAPPKPESVWRWWQRKSKFYTMADCNPFFPGRRTVVPGVINLWSGYVCHRFLDDEWFKTVTADELARSVTCDFDFFMWYIHQVICNKSTGMFYRFLIFLRQLILNPEEPASMIPIFEGGGGVGKSSLLEWLCQYVFGTDHSIVLQTVSHLTNGFNSLAEKITFAMIDEAGSVNDDTLQKVKYATTAKQRIIEKKFQESSVVTSPVSLLFSCNKVGVSLELDERRFIGGICDPLFAARNATPERKLLMDRFYLMTHDPAQAQELARHFVCMLVRFLDASEYNHIRSVPFVSPLYLTMLRQGASPVERFLVECVETRSNIPSGYRFEYGVIDFVQSKGNWGTYYPFLALVQHYRSFSDFRKDHRHQLTLREFLVEKIGCTIADGPAGHVWITWPSIATVLQQLSLIRPSSVDIRQMDYVGLPGFIVDASGQLYSENPPAWFDLWCFPKKKKDEPPEPRSPSPGPPTPSVNLDLLEYELGRRSEQFYGGCPKKLRRRYDAEDDQSSTNEPTDESDEDNDVRRDYMGEDAAASDESGDECVWD